MKVLVHYTTHDIVYEIFNQDRHIIERIERKEEIETYYDKYHLIQQKMFFVVCLYKEGSLKYTVGEISKENEKFIYIKSPIEVASNVIDSLGLKTTNTYERDVYYKEFILDEAECKFYNKGINDVANKIKMKYYDWDSLLSNDLLQETLVNLLFDTQNVLRIGSTYSPTQKYSQKGLERKYIETLKSIGFITKGEINVNRTVLHGDIGEFLMHVLATDFIKGEKHEKYYYPKLVLKSSPNSAVHGNDGTIYLPASKEVYYMEAKFYSTLNKAINAAVDSLNAHNQECNTEFLSKIELFRNLDTGETHQIVEIMDDYKENLLLFLMCEDVHKLSDIKTILEDNTKLKTLQSLSEIIVFVLPVLDKDKFLEIFKTYSNRVKAEIYD